MVLIYLLGIILLGSIITFFSGNKFAERISLIFSFLAFIPLCLLIGIFHKNPIDIIFFKEWIKNPEINFHLLLNGKSLIFVLLTIILFPIIILSSSIQKVKDKKSFYSLILLMEFALIGTFLASNGILFYIFWELTLIPIYFISLLWGDKDSKKSTLTFFLYTFIGSLFLLIGIILYSYFQPFAIENSSLVFWFILLAFLIKIPIFPFHSWQANVYKSAPMVGSMLLSGIMLKMGFWGIYNWLYPYIDPNIFECNQNLLLILALIGVLYGAFLAIKQNNLKKLLAYSSFSHVGLITMGLFIENSSSINGMFFQSFAHGINIVGLFYIVQIIYNRTGTFKINELGGIWQKAPIFSALTLIIVLASISMPLTNAFVGEFLLLNGIFQFNWVFGLIASISVILGAVYMLRMYQYTFLGKTNSNTENFKDLNLYEALILILLVIIIFFTGIYPDVILHFITL